MSTGDPTAQTAQPSPASPGAWGSVLRALQRISAAEAAPLVEVGTLSAVLGRPAPQLREALQELERRQLVILVCGGTGVYVTGAGRRWDLAADG